MVMFSLFGSSGMGQQVTFSTVPAGQFPESTGCVVEVDDFLGAEQIAVVRNNGRKIDVLVLITTEEQKRQTGWRWAQSRANWFSAQIPC